MWLYLLKRWGCGTNAARLQGPWAAVHEYTMNPGLFIISPLISLMPLLMPSGPRWHCKPFNHWLTPMHTRELTHSHISHNNSNLWFSINYFPRLCAYRKILIAIRILCFVGDWIDRCVQSLWIHNEQVLHSLAAWRGFQLIVLELPHMLSCGLIDWWSIIDFCAVGSEVGVRPSLCVLFYYWDALQAYVRKHKLLYRLNPNGCFKTGNFIILSGTLSRKSQYVESCH